MAEIGRVGNGSSPNPNFSSPVKEKMRFEYNPHTKTFEPIEGETKKNETMERTEQNVAKVKVPTDYSSPALLKNAGKQTTPKGDHIQSDTQGVGAFFSGNASLYPSFISSISKAQDQV